MLPAFHLITYRGQKDKCEMLDLKLIDSINCNRNEILPRTNLRDYHPSKTLPIPEMEIACFLQFRII